jgi:ATP/maltotriose-dependent transcriptional regulator MalT
MNKLGVSNRTQAVLAASKLDVLAPELSAVDKPAS